MTNEEWMEFMRQSIASHDRQIAELVEQGARLDAWLAAHAEEQAKQQAATNRQIAALGQDMAVLTDRMHALTGHMASLADHMSALAELGIDHERRVRRLE